MVISDWKPPTTFGLNNSEPIVRTEYNTSKNIADSKSNYKETENSYSSYKIAESK